jgi:hypothetical protein
LPARADHGAYGEGYLKSQTARYSRANMLRGALQACARSASSSTLVRGFRKNDSSGIRRALTPWRSSAAPTTGPTAATSVRRGAALLFRRGGREQPLDLGVLVKATHRASRLPGA